MFLSTVLAKLNEALHDRFGKKKEPQPLSWAQGVLDAQGEKPRAIKTGRYNDGYVEYLQAKQRTFKSQDRYQAYEAFRTLALLCYDMNGDVYQERWNAVNALAKDLIGPDVVLPQLT